MNSGTVGDSFDTYLEEEGTLKETTESAIQRVSLLAEDLSPNEISAIRNSKVETDREFKLEDLPDHLEVPFLTSATPAHHFDANSENDPILDEETVEVLRARRDAARSEPGERVSEFRDRFNKRKRVLLEGAARSSIKNEIKEMSYFEALMSTPFTARQAEEVAIKTIIDVLSDLLEYRKEAPLSDREISTLHEMGYDQAALICTKIQTDNGKRALLHVGATD